MKRDAKQIDGLRELIALLGRITTTNEALLLRINEKIDAVKRADIESLRLATLAEQRLVQEIEDHNGIRRPLMDRVGVALGFGPGVGRTMTVSQILERLPEKSASALTDAATRLREVMVQVTQANRAAGWWQRAKLESSRPWGNESLEEADPQVWHRLEAGEDTGCKPVPHWFNRQVRVTGHGTA